MTVHRDGEELGRVLDVRVSNRGGDLECRHLIVGRARPGTMLGYDRSRHMGPAVLSHLVRWLHRHTGQVAIDRSEEHTSELQSLMRISYAVFCLKKKKTNIPTKT